MKGYVRSIEKAAQQNTTFRAVLYTAKNCQLVVMSLRAGEDIGAEVHKLEGRIDKNDESNGYAIAWDGPPDRMIFVQSQNKMTHGLGDANFVTAPARNACILNSITGKEIYRVDDDDRLVALR